FELGLVAFRRQFGNNIMNSEDKHLLVKYLAFWIKSGMNSLISELLPRTKRNFMLKLRVLRTIWILSYKCSGHCLVQECLSVFQERKIFQANTADFIRHLAD
ncbi:hypothetical protein NPIL_561151, partial [Nephila pilipes]